MMIKFNWKTSGFVALAVVALAASSCVHASGGVAEGTIRGTVIAPPGVQIKVQADDLVTGLSYKTAVEGSGEFSLRVPAGNYAVSADAYEYVLVRTGVLTVESDRDTLLADNIVLVKGGSITGKISSSYRGDHILVFALKRGKFGGWETWMDRTQADEAGQYTIGRLPAGTYDMAIISSGSGVNCFLPQYSNDATLNAAVKLDLQLQLNKRSHAISAGRIEDSLSLLANDYHTSDGEGLEAVRAEVLRDRQERQARSPEGLPARGTISYEVRSCSADDEQAIAVVSRENKDAEGRTEWINRTELLFWTKENDEWRIKFWSIEPPIPLGRAEREWKWSGISEPSKRPKSFVPKMVFSRKMTGIVVKAGEATSGVDYQLQ